MNLPLGKYAIVHTQPTHRCATPTEVAVGRWGELNVFTCPNDPEHPHRWSIQ
ncbi:hypothetical protein [Streptomyces sp. SYSU K21746]